MNSYDPLICRIADFVCSNPDFSKKEEAWNSMRLAFLDSIGCCAAAVTNKDCQRHLEQNNPGSLHIPFLNKKQDLLQGAKSLSTMIRWMDFNDTWLAKEWAHPSDNIGPILSLGQFLEKQQKLTLKTLFNRFIQAYEIQGRMALDNCFNKYGIDHVILVKLASTAVCSAMISQNKHEEVKAAISQVFVDGHPLRTYRHAPNTGPRKSWAAGDAAKRALELTLLSSKGEPGIPSVLRTVKWGFEDSLMRGKHLTIPKEFNSYVIENILFKVSFPAEFHAQTAIEAAIFIHHKIKSQISDIHKIIIHTQKPAMRIICKEGELLNHAARDHCLQYMVAIALLKGSLSTEDYSDSAATDPRIDHLRSLMSIKHRPEFSRDYLDPKKRSVANQICITLKDGSQLKHKVEFPLGHRKRRKESIPAIIKKFSLNFETLFPPEKTREISQIILDSDLNISPAEFCASIKPHLLH